jgi:hypothetical protein
LATRSRATDAPRAREVVKDARGGRLERAERTFVDDDDVRAGDGLPDPPAKLAPVALFKPAVREAVV